MPDFLADALTWPQNYNTALAVQTAYEMGIRPLVFLRGEQPTDPWTDIDRKLLMAWTILQKETCQECGQPLWICRSDNSNLTFAVRKGTCYSKLAIERWRDSADAKKERKGQTVFTVPSRYDDTVPLPTRREWLEQLKEE